jgi:hypothetical protein
VSKRFLFIGEKPSPMADTKDRVWADGGLAAKQLFDGLRANEIDPEKCVFFNLFGDHAEADERVHAITPRVQIIKSLARANRLQIVAMGNKVANHLRYFQIDHRAIVHPAARGAIRGKEVYAAHIAERLAS